MMEAVETMQTELKKLRAGRASPEQIQDIKVKAYDMWTPLKELGQISVRDAYNLIVTVHDPSILPLVDAGIRNSDEVSVSAKVCAAGRAHLPATNPYAISPITLNCVPVLPSLIFFCMSLAFPGRRKARGCDVSARDERNPSRTGQEAKKTGQAKG
jgi:hypothetical protein